MTAADVLGDPDEFLVWVQDNQQLKETGTNYIRFHGWELARDQRPMGPGNRFASTVAVYMTTDQRFVTRIEVDDLERSARVETSAIWGAIHDSWTIAKKWLDVFCATATERGLGHSDAADIVARRAEQRWPDLRAVG